MYSKLEPEYVGIIGWVARMALQIISNSDALYHDVEHTIMVTLVGQEILKGKQILEGNVSPRDWLHFILSLLCHDIGYVRGILRSDRDGKFSTGLCATTSQVELSGGATDASLTPWHVDRGKRFVRERFAGHKIIDAELIATNIEHTRFPVPEDTDHQDTGGYPGLVRAADLVGQLADPSRSRKIPALFYEFEETGMNKKLGYKCIADLRADYPGFFFNVASRYIKDAVRFLKVTQEGKQWLSNLYSEVFQVQFDVNMCLESSPLQTMAGTPTDETEITAQTLPSPVQKGDAYS